MSPVIDTFASCNLSSTFALKACGFIESQKARILDVDEQGIRLQVGCSFIERVLNGNPGTRRITIDVCIREPDPRDEALISRSHSRQRSLSYVDVIVRPGEGGWDRKEFQSEARRIVRLLRSYFMACSN